MQNEKKKKVTPTEKVMQYAHCLNWRPSEWKTDDGEEEDKNKSWLYNEIEFVNLHSLSIPVPESDCFHSMALTRFTIYSIVLCICRKLLQLATYAISTYTIQFWNVDSWWNLDFLQSSDSIDLCSMNTWALSMWFNIFIQLVNDAMIQRAAKCKWKKHRNYEEQRDVCFSKCYDLILHEKKTIDK